jgi:hypothetical protein
MYPALTGLLETPLLDCNVAVLILGGFALTAALAVAGLMF